MDQRDGTRLRLHAARRASCRRLGRRNVLRTAVDHAAGKIFQIVSHGYGFMRSYSDVLSVDERWAVIGYLRALQLRSGVSLEGLPLALQDRAKAALR